MPLSWRLAAIGFAIFAYQQRGIALQATETAKLERDNALKAEQVAGNASRQTLRQLNLANQALAQSINNDLDLSSDNSLTPRQRQALWKLAVADEPVKSDFISILAKNPEETARVSHGFAQISRALGLLRPSAAEVEGLLDPVLTQIGQTTHFFELRTLAEALQTLGPKLSESQASQALEPVLKQIGQTTNSLRLSALADALQALAPRAERSGGEQGARARAQTDRPLDVG